MTSEHPTARLDIDLGALLHNYRALQRQCPGAEIAPVVKADAYGLGMAAIAPHLARHGARTFFVARLDEGIALRHTLPEAVIYVLDGLAGDPQAFLTHNLRPVLNSAEQYAKWLQLPAGIEAALHIDTGMNRLGVRSDDLAALPKTHRLSLVMSHLACGDERDHPMNARQLTAFRDASAAFAAPKSLANSAGAFLGPDYHFDLIRPGISLYGGGPFGVAHPDIRPVARLTARILQVRPLKPCETVGYGATYEAADPMQLATIGIGYADGLLRSFAPNGFVTVNGEQRRLTGRVSMDVCSLDVTGLDVQVGDEVEILGPAQNLDAVAAASGTIGYEWLTRLGPRIPRHYRS